MLTFGVDSPSAGHHLIPDFQLQGITGQICCFAEHINGEHFAVAHLKRQYTVAWCDLGGNRFA